MENANILAKNTPIKGKGKTRPIVVEIRANVPEAELKEVYDAQK